uniref:Uncharacterized protein n=1 Tax=Meloidogyne javanica TaxID=6303 RepID=A0A915LFS7_MELJA
MDDEFGQHYGEVRESIDGINIYHQYGGFGYPQQGYSPKLDFNHQPKHYYENPPPTPRFSNYEESVGSNDNGCEFTASGSGHRLQTGIPEKEKQFLSVIDSDEEEIAEEQVERTNKFKAEISEVTEDNEENVPYSPQSPEGAPGKLYKYDMNKNIKKENKECCIIL